MLTAEYISRGYYGRHVGLGDESDSLYHDDTDAQGDDAPSDTADLAEENISPPDETQLEIADPVETDGQVTIADLSEGDKTYTYTDSDGTLHTADLDGNDTTTSDGKDTDSASSDDSPVEAHKAKDFGGSSPGGSGGGSSMSAGKSSGSSSGSKSSQSATDQLNQNMAALTKALLATQQAKPKSSTSPGKQVLSDIVGALQQLKGGGSSSSKSSGYSSDNYDDYDDYPSSSSTGQGKIVQSAIGPSTTRAKASATAPAPHGEVYDLLHKKDKFTGLQYGTDIEVLVGGVVGLAAVIAVVQKLKGKKRR